LTEGKRLAYGGGMDESKERQLAGARAGGRNRAARMSPSARTATARQAHLIGSARAVIARFAELPEDLQNDVREAVCRA
jgi:hypothetical protein